MNRRRRRRQPFARARADRLLLSAPLVLAKSFMATKWQSKLFIDRYRYR